MLKVPVSQPDEGVSTAVKHALGWLVLGNAVGLYLSLLLLKPQWQLGEWTYGRWVPVHLNVQLYGWTALPLVAWLFSIYEVNLSKAASWASAAVWAWTAALALGAVHWLTGVTGGKIFLDWKDGALWAFVVALSILWLVLAVAWQERARTWSRPRRRFSLGGLLVLAMVPASIVLTASPKTYPPIDPTTGGPSGSSLLGSSLIVVGLMLMLPRVVARTGTGDPLAGEPLTLASITPVVIGGTEKMITFDELQPSEKLKIYDKGVSFTDDPAKIHEMRVGYRTGDMWAPKVDGSEALLVEGKHFVECIRTGKKPVSDGEFGFRMVELIEAATGSMRGRGETIHLPKKQISK